MGKAKFWPPGAPKPLNGFRWNLEYITGPRLRPHMQINVALRQRGWSGRTREKKCCGFLGIPFKKFFCFILRLAPSEQSGPILTIYMSYHVLPPKDVPFGVSFILLPFWGQNPPKTPVLGAWIGIFKLNVQNIKICILSKFLHRLPPNFAQSQRLPSTLRGWSQHA